MTPPDSRGRVKGCTDSTRTVDLCVSAADPLELAFRPSSAFQKAGESEELKALRFQHHEQMRQVSLLCGSSERRAVLTTAL